MSLRYGTHGALFKMLFIFFIAILFAVASQTDLRLAGAGYKWNSEKTVWMVEVNHKAHTVETAERLYTTPLLNRLKALESNATIYGLTYPQTSVFFLLSSQHQPALVQRARQILDEANENNHADGAYYQFVIKPLAEMEQHFRLGFRSHADDNGRLWDVVKNIAALYDKNPASHAILTINPDTRILLDDRPLSEASLLTARALLQLDGIMAAYIKNIMVPTVQIQIDSTRASRFNLLAGDVLEKTRSMLKTPFAAAVENQNEKLVTTRSAPSQLSDVANMPLHFLDHADVRMSSFSTFAPALVHAPLFLPDSDDITPSNSSLDAARTEPAEIDLVFSPGVDRHALQSKIEDIVFKNLGNTPLLTTAPQPLWGLMGLFGLAVFLLSFRLKHRATFQHAGLAFTIIACAALLLNFSLNFINGVYIAALSTAVLLARHYETKSDHKNLPIGLLGRVSSLKILFLLSSSLLLVQWLSDVEAITLPHAAFICLLATAFLLSEELILAKREAVFISFQLDKDLERKMFLKAMAVVVAAGFMAQASAWINPSLTHWQLGIKNIEDAKRILNAPPFEGSKFPTKTYGFTNERQLTFSLTEAGRGPGAETLLSRATAALSWQPVGWMNLNGLPTLVRIGEERFTKAFGVDEAFIEARSWLSQILVGDLKDRTPLSKFATASIASRLGMRMRNSSGDAVTLEVVRPASVAIENELLTAHPTQDIDLKSDQQKHQNVSHQFALWFMLYTCITFLLSSLLFNSLGRGLQLVATFLLNYIVLYNLTCIMRLCTNAAPVEFENLQLEFSFYLAFGLTTLWSAVALASDSRRLSGFAIAGAFDFCKPSFRRVAHVSLALCLVSCVLCFFDKRMFYFALPTLGLFIFLEWLAIGWFMIWILLTELFYRYLLRWSIGVAKKTVLLLVLLTLANGLLGTTVAQAAESVQSISANCTNIVTVVFPLHGRPKGVESPVVKSVYTERLAQEIPCSYIDLSKTNELLDLHTSARETRAQSEILNRLKQFLQNQNESIGDELAKRFPQFKETHPQKIRVLGGYFEEFFGATAFTIIEVQNGVLNGVVKEWFAPGEEVNGIANLARQLKNEDSLFIENILQKHQRVPVYLSKVESLDKHPLSENLSEEVDVFLRARLLYPTSRFVFERRAFFTEAKDLDKSKYVVDLKIRRDGVRIFASGLIESRENQTRRTFWIESDISNIHHFTDTVFETLERELAALDGIFNYVVVAGPEFWFQKEHGTRFMTAQFRQNRGNVAFGLRIRNGELEGPEKNMRALTIGGLAGWQFIDLRWLAADVGFSLDLGSFGETFTKLFFERSLIASYGGYAQTQFIFYKNFAFMARAGLEKPMQISVNPTTTQLLLPALSQSLLLGVGVAF